MTDMLVKLYNLPDHRPSLEKLEKQGIEIRRVHPAEKNIITSWVQKHFWESWASECGAALEHRPTTCFIATEKQPFEHQLENPYIQAPEKLIGFASYDATAKGMFGPTGVDDAYRGRGIGKALLLACLHAMKIDGYAYAAIGWVGPAEFYERTVGATIIEGSAPGIYRGPLIGDAD